MRNAVTSMLCARSIAVIGASDKPDSFGHNVVLNLTSNGYMGKVYPVNPRYETVEGLQCYPGMADLPEAVDCALLAVADERLEISLQDAATAGAHSAVLFGSAVEERQPGRPPLTERLAAIAREAGMAMCGANCMGFLNFVDPVMVGGWLYKDAPPLGHVGLITHSGSSYSALAHNQRQLGMNYLISSGQELVTTAADYIRFLVAHPETRVIGCILETARDPELFLVALKEADGRGIPVVILKLGRSERGRAMSRSHSGAFAGSHSAYRAIFEHYNAISVETLDELADTLELLSCGRSPPTDAIGLATDSGGERSMIVDLAAEIGVEFANLAAKTTNILSATLDAGLEPINPVDIWGTGHDHERIAETCIQALVDDPAVGQVVFANDMPGGRQLVRTWGGVTERVHATTKKPVMAMGNLSSAIDRAEAARLRALGVPVLMGTRSGLVAIAALANWHKKRRARRPMKIEALAPEIVDRWKERLRLVSIPSLNTVESLQLAADFGCPVIAGREAETLEEVIAAADQIGFPLVLKTLAPDLDHKFDQGGVVVGLDSPDALARAYRDMHRHLGPRVLVQAQVAAGTELFMGTARDEQFGPLITIGIGGTFVEILRDVVTVVPPVDTEAAIDHLRRLKGFPLLDGARNRPRADLHTLGQVIARFSVLAVSLRDYLKEMDINPIIAGMGGAWAVDALAVPSFDPVGRRGGISAHAEFGVR